MGRGGFGASSDRVGAVREKPRVVSRALEATRHRTAASILGSDKTTLSTAFSTPLVGPSIPHVSRLDVQYVYS